jgi:hypothetical protein
MTQPNNWRRVISPAQCRAARALLKWSLLETAREPYVSNAQSL